MTKRPTGPLPPADPTTGRPTLSRPEALPAQTLGLPGAGAPRDPNGQLRPIPPPHSNPKAPHTKPAPTPKSPVAPPAGTSATPHSSVVRAAHGAAGAKPQPKSSRPVPPRKLPRVHRFRWPLLPRAVKLLLQGTLGLAFLGMLTLAVLYLLVLQGPISMGFLVGPIERSINAELGAGRVEIENAVLRQSEDGRGIEFRLANLRVKDAGGTVLAETPLAGISLSGAALLRGRLAPVSVEFIRPRLRLTTTPDGGLALAVSSAPVAVDRAAATRTRAVLAPAATSPPGTAATATPPPEPPSRIDLVAVLQSTIADIRNSEAASAYLREFGIRDAVLTIEHGGREAVWQVPGFSIDVQHFQKRSVVVGEGLIGSAAGPWGLSFKTTESNKAKRIRFETQIAELVPKAIADNLPFLPGLAAFDMATAGTAKFDMAFGEGVAEAEVKVALSPGRLILPAAVGGTVQVAGGALHLTYSSAEHRIVLHPSELIWNKSRAIWSGAVTPGASDAEPWRFELSSRNANLEGVTLDSIDVSGSMVPRTRQARIDKLQVVAQGVQIAMAGGMAGLDGGQTLQLDGRVGPVTLAQLSSLWPSHIAPKSLAWLRENVKKGQTSGGTIKLGPRPAAKAAGAASGETAFLANLSLDLDVQDLHAVTIDGALPVVVEAGRLRIAGDRLELTAAQAKLPLPSGRAVALKDAKLVLAPLSSPDTQAEVTLQSLAPASVLLELADAEPFKFLQNSGIEPGTIEGRAETSLKLAFPATADVKIADIKLDGRIKVADARAKGLSGGLDLTGGNLVVGITDKALDAKGDLLIAGIPAKIFYQRIFGAPADRQPPARLTASLDAADRDAVGLAVNHMVMGEVPIVVTLQPDAAGQHAIHLEANLGPAELLVENMAWRKAAGRPAVLHSDITRTKDGRVELTAFKIVGDDIALDGHVTLDAKNQLRAFNFPAFAVNVFTKLDIAGRVRDDGVLEVKTKGTAYDGRPFFRSLFSPGQISERAAAPKNRPGLDLFVEIDTLVGYTDTSLKSVRFNLKRRADKIVALQATGILSESGIPVAAEIRQQNGARVLHATSDDAGAAMRLMGFYPNMRGGKGVLDVNLDGKGHAEKTGRLRAADFAILGDPVVSDLLQGPDEVRKAGRKVVREQVEFERLDLPFSVGHGQVVLGDSTINGPLLGARLNGKIDYNSQTVFLEGTYVPLYGLNSIPNSIPIIGDILSGGRTGDGLFGMTFQIQGPMGRPQVLVNPLSMLTPGLLRQIWETAPQGQSVVPRAEPQATSAPPRSSSAPPQTTDQRGAANRASSSGPQRIDAPAKASTSGTAPGATAPAAAPSPRVAREKPARQDDGQ